MTEARQHIARLAPLDEVLQKIDTHTRPVAPREVVLAESLGLTLASDVVAPQERPASALALHDGWAVTSDATADASAYAPIPLAAAPSFVETGEPLPAGADAIAPLDAVILRGGLAEAIASVAIGEGVLPAGGDVRRGEILRRADERVRATDAAAFASIGLAHVTARAPRVMIARAGVAANDVIDGAAGWLAGAVRAAGGLAVLGERSAGSLAPAFTHEAADAVVVIGGTGMGRRDASVHALAQAGRVEAHGIAISPGATAAFGMAGARPVLLMPGRLDAVIAVWLLLGRRMMMRLCDRDDRDDSVALALTRKISSTLGMTEFVPVRREGPMATPLASGYLPFGALARADGWVLVAPDSEGFPAGATVQVRAWP